MDPSSKRRMNDSFKSLFFVSSGLSLLTCFSIFFYITSTSRMLSNQRYFPARTHLISVHKNSLQSVSPPLHGIISSPPADIERQRSPELEVSVNGSRDITIPQPAAELLSPFSETDQNQWAEDGDSGKKKKDNQLEVYHDRKMFMQEYKEMNKTLKIFIYPPKPNDPYADLLLPEKIEPGGNYASESFFKKNLFTSHFITKNPAKADLFYLPFSIATLRHDKRIGVRGIPGFVRDYVANVSRDYPYWNRTGGADHFYVACHSIGKTAMDKAVYVKTNAIQVVCSASYFLTGYVSHKDASIPQIWPRSRNIPKRKPSLRKRLAFYAGAMNSRERKFLVQVWGNDTKISVHQSRLKTPYSEALLGSKFCLHAKGFEVNTARIGDALYYGCVPVILADHYDLPFSDILDWRSISVVMMSADIPSLKKILEEKVKSGRYLRLQSNVMEAQKHFQWHRVPEDYDAFYMAMFELWLRRSHLRLENDLWN